MTTLPSEYAIQLAIRSWLSAHRIDTVHVPNGMAVAGNSRQRSAHIAKMKRAGMLSGFPDLILFPRHLPGSIAFFEVKAEGGRTTPAQEACIVWLESLSHKVAVVRSIEDARCALEAWGWLPSDPDVAIIGDVTARVLSNLERAA